ncbi:hypothetical protein CONPUDRAFT_160765 [Coniophora puteana RWD-64-598 SS2]|uniref:Uncharacterized protein n=1 Tax=Coniophora puteana (strain RWD-64-598) TaxID=741705 RepID=R7SC46_CONPW|nr:uncharacterized protein CONPUDRAFT_160765 [Coniophora puteana RWD-64-598 SS2]EIW73741.1 hypothetical protein CONPUDRAFT_160765 [Coniophora puteana RWD-64-598 SS2]
MRIAGMCGIPAGPLARLQCLPQAAKDTLGGIQPRDRKHVRFAEWGTCTCLRKSSGG